MNILFYPQIALNSIRKNKRLYYPYFLACTAVVSMFYIMHFITTNQRISALSAVSSLQMITALGCIVIGVFSIFFLGYTNSFLSKRRKHEFGLYNVLGMSKRNLAFILFFETMMSSCVSLLFGLLVGIVFSKGAELLLLNMIGMEVDYIFEISSGSITTTCMLYLSLFAILYFKNVAEISFSKTVDLNKSDQAGEKEPKANWLLGLLGVVILGAAYYIALTIKNAFSAISMFFIAVLMVIVATYLLFIAGSVAICKLLQKNKRFYYTADHFFTTSNMAYRMKRNGTGLATICILSTMVLVMISSTASLYYGAKSAVYSRYKHDTVIEVQMNENQFTRDNIDIYRDTIENVILAHQLTTSNLSEFSSFSVVGNLHGAYLDVDSRHGTDISVNNLNLIMVNVIPLDDYNRLMGKDIVLQKGTALCYSYDNKYHGEGISFGDELKYNLLYQKDVFESGASATTGLLNSLCIIVDDFDECASYIGSLMEDGLMQLSYNYEFDMELDEQYQSEFRKDMSKALLAAEGQKQYIRLNVRAVEIKDFITSYGGLFFLGITLSIVFLFTTVLIMYYKQINEGFEDQIKFEIMKKIGMTNEEIYSSIKSQMKLVFASPLLFAIIHLCCALPMIHYLLTLFGLVDTKPLIIASAICIGIYALFYIMVYQVTSSTYYSLVTTVHNDEV